jgi:hypothetical protein
MLMLNQCADGEMVSLHYAINKRLVNHMRPNNPIRGFIKSKKTGIFLNFYKTIGTVESFLRTCENKNLG